MNRRRQRASDSPLVQHVTEVEYGAPTRELSTPDGCWDIVVMRRGGDTFVLQTGLLSRPVILENAPGDSYLAISFRPGVFMPALPGAQMLDRGVARPLASASRFAVDREVVEIPTFENAEGLVNRLLRRGLLARDALVESAAEGHPLAISPRAMQRHFALTLGMTPKRFAQIQRSCRAVDLLARGVPPAAVAAELGYADQPHLTRSLKIIMGRTPGELARRRGG